VHPLALVEAVEGPVQGGGLEGAHGVVVDVGGDAGDVEPRAAFGPEDVGDRASIEIFDGLDVDVDGIQSERGEGPVGAGLAARQLVRGQDLQQALPRAAQPGGAQRQVGDLADAPVAPGADGEERKDHARFSIHEPFTIAQGRSRATHA
jgi:hypothetical protein